MSRESRCEVKPLADAVGVALDRRAFMLGAGTVAGAMLTPLPVLAASTTAASGPAESWSIDDMWGVHTRYADPIGFGRAAPVPRATRIEPVDAPWCD